MLLAPLGEGALVSAEGAWNKHVAFVGLGVSCSFLVPRKLQML